MKFRSDVAGSVTGIRFYKTSGMAGPYRHVVVDRGGQPGDGHVLR